MKKTFTTISISKGRLFSSAGIAALTLAAIASPAYAQDETAEEVEASSLATEETPDTGAIVVTGSRIARPELKSSVPITILSGDQIFNQASINVGDTLNDLPQLRSTFSQTNAGRFLGTTGLNLLDLRGLGTVRTLTLVNGRRHVPSDILANGTSTDVNTIPADLIERIDIVTGGNSAIYGSDAIAGVVNFILKDNFEGLQLRGHANVNYDGQFPGQYISGMYGQNFAEGRGNVTLHGEYSNQERVFGSDIDFLRTNKAFLVIDNDPALPNGSDGFPDRAFFTNVSSASIFFNGLVPFPQTTAKPACGQSLGATNGGPAANSTPFNCTFIFTPDGQLIPQTGGRTGATSRIGSIFNSNGQSGRESTLLSVMPRQERINANLLAHFEITPAFVPFIEAKYVNIKTQGQQSSPAFVQGQTFGDVRERPRLDNPFLSPQARSVIEQQLVASGLQSRLTAGAGLPQGPITGATRFVVARFLLDLGNRDEKSEREVYRIVGGLKGDFADNFRYELSVNYGQVNEDTTILGNIIPQRFMLAMDAARDPATGNIVCRSQLDPTNPANLYGLDGDAEALQAEIAACVPYNPFGVADNSAAAAFILEDTVSRAKLEQLVISGFVSGDTGSFLNLPGGPVGFAVGGEYRKEKLFYQADPIVEQGRTFYNALPTFAPPPFDVKEAFAEVRIPLLADLPLIQELTISAAGRLSDYGGAVGTTKAYNAGVEWQIIPDIRLRAQYGRSVRAPNLTETSFPLTQNFAPGFQDPCRAANINVGTQFRAVNCAADLGALLTTPQFASLPAYSLEVLSGSNVDLRAEQSDSYTIGAVFTPTFLPGFSLTVDYYDIKVKNVITSISAQTVANTCYDLPDLNNQFCSLFERFRGPGFGPNDEVPGQILDANAEIIPLNFAARTVRGVDVEAAYRYSFGENSAIGTRLIYTHLFERSNFENPSTPDFENRILGELGDPQDEFRWNVDLKVDAFKLGYTMQYIGPQVLNLFEDINALQDRDPQNADFADIAEYPAVFYHDVRMGYELDNGFEFTLGVDNILNTNPPLDLTGIGGGSAIYRVRGRNFFAGFRARF